MSAGDKLVYEMASETESYPSIFVRKDFVQVNDSQNGVYTGANSVINTIEISNSNKYANWREGYLSIPLLLTLTSSSNTSATAFAPSTAATSADYALGLKNSFLHLIHSLEIQYNGSSISQITPYCSLWNCFKLMTTLSYNDMITQGSSIGFWKDTSTSFAFNGSANPNGIGVSNNQNFFASPVVSGALNSYDVYNEGFLKRQQYINFDPAGLTAPSQSAFSTLFTATNCNTAYKSYVSNKVNGVASTSSGVFQQSVMATIMLKHIHHFFDKMPLTKGSSIRISLNLNNTSVQFTAAGSGGNLSAQSITTALGGVNPLMVSSALASNGCATLGADTFIASLSVGAICLNTTQKAMTNISTGQLGTQITLSVPLYTFNPIFENVYLSNPVKTVVYEDIYNFVSSNIASGANYNILCSNGISNLNKFLLLPYHSAVSAVNGAILPFQSGFDSAGGTTSPLCLQSNFNVVVSGQNILQSNAKYNAQMFLEQVAGINGINDNLTDGLSSGLISQLDWETLYNYYVVDIGRSLPQEKDVPRSVSVIGTNLSAVAVDFYIFISFFNTIKIDCLTGSRVG